MRYIRKALTVFTSCVLAVTAVGGLLCGRVSGAGGRLTVDTQTGTVTSGADGGIVYLELLDGNGEKKRIRPDSDAFLAYDIEVLKGRAYISPDATAFDSGNAFTDAVKTAAGLEITEEKYLPEGHYTGKVSVETIGWAPDNVIDCIMVKLYADSQIKLNKMKFTVPKTETVETADFLTSYVPNTAGIASITADSSTGIITSGSQWGTVYLDLYNSPGGSRAAISPAAGDLLYYDFSVEMVEHNIEETSDEHAYHGRARINPIPWGSSSEAIADAFMYGVSANSGTATLEGKLPAGTYKGTLDLAEIWKSGNTTNCIAVNIGEYTKLVIREMKLVRKNTVPEQQDVPSGNLIESYTVNTNGVGSITADSLAGTVTSGSQWGTVYLDLYKSEGGERAAISLAAGDLLYYDFSVEMVEHNISETPDEHAYHGRARIEPIPWGSSSAVIANAFMNGVSADSGTAMLEGKLPAGSYKGILDLTAVWKSDNTTNCIAVNLGEYTKLTLREMKLVRLTGGIESEDLPGGDMLEHYKAVNEPDDDGEEDNKGNKDDNENSGKNDGDFSVTDGNVTYNYAEYIDLGMTDMYDASGLKLEPEKTENGTEYTRTGNTNAWISEANMEKEIDFSKFNGYLVYDFSVKEGAVSLAQNFGGDISVNIAAQIARNHGIRLTDTDKLPRGEYKGVIKLKGWPSGTAVMKTLSAWSTEGSVFTVKTLNFINAQKITGENPVKKIILTDLLPETEKGWAKEFEGRNADISGNRESGWKLSVPNGKKDASARAYFSYTETDGSRLLLCYDFTIENGEAGVHLRAGVRTENDEETARTYANGKNSLTLTSYIAGAAGVTPIEDRAYGEDRLPAGHYKGVIDLEGDIPESFKKGGYSWWDCGIVGEGASVTFRELAFAQGVTADPVIAKTGDSTAVLPMAAVFALSAVSLAAVLIIKKKSACRNV